MVIKTLTLTKKILMKTFILTLSLLTMISAQAASISSKTASEIESNIYNQRKDFVEKTAFPIGNKRFVMVSSFQIETLLQKAHEMLNAITVESNLSEKEIVEKIKDIEYFLNTSSNLINQLPY